MPTLKIPLVGRLTQGTPGGYSSFGVPTAGWVFQDGVFQRNVNQASRELEIYFRSREIYSKLINLSAVTTTAVMEWLGKNSPGYFAFAHGNVNSDVHVALLAADTNLGAITGVVQHLSETLVGGVPTIVAIGNATRGRTWFYPDGGALTEITHANFPPTAGLTLTGNAVHVDGYMSVLTTGAQLHTSIQGSVATWGPERYISFNRKPDRGVGAMRVKDVVAIFGSDSIEFCKNVGNPTNSPFRRIPDAFVNLGCLNEHAMCEYKDTVAFIGKGGAQNLGVYVLNGFTADMISDDFIGSVLAYANYNGSLANARLFLLQSHGRFYLALQVEPGLGTIFVYDDQLQSWGVWTTGSLVDGTVISAPSTNYVMKTSSFINGQMLTASSGGGIFISNAISFEYSRVRGGPIDFGTPKRKRINTVTIYGDGVLAGTLTWKRRVETVETSDTYTFSAPVGDRLDVARLNNLGECLSGEFFISCTNNQTRLRSIEFDFEVLGT